MDAVTTLRVGRPTDPTTVVGPLIERAEGKLLRALTELDEGEEWLVEPRAIDATDEVWSPGVRRGRISRQGRAGWNPRPALPISAI